MVVIAFSGKGGTGKTTLTALSVMYFSEKGQVSLALDMDPDSHLYKLLGFPLKKTIGQMVDRVYKEKKFELEPKKPPDVADIDYFYSLVMSNVLVEVGGSDLITLGKPASDIDCYCPVFYWAEHAMSNILKSYKKPYDNIVVDCDPGTEIFPRKILDTIAKDCGIDYVFTVLDASRMSLDTAKDIREEIQRKHLNFGRTIGICNRVDEQETQQIIRTIAKTQYDQEIVGFIPTDKEIAGKSLMNQSIMDIPSSAAYQSMKEALRKIHI